MDRSDAWPSLPFAQWRDTCETLHLWTQIVGKVRLACTPWLNHSWHVPLYVTSRGLTTSPIFFESRSFEISFDFVAHTLCVLSSDGRRIDLELVPRTVAEFYRRVRSILDRLDLPVSITSMPNEIPNAIPFDQDEQHGSYDAEYVYRFWRVLLQSTRVFAQFRTGFVGKSSPVHFFWGGFDLAVTRFSGRRAPLHAGGVPHLADAVVREAYSHEVSSAGFWPGGNGVDASFYSYAYPEPAGYRDSAVTPRAAAYSTNLGEFLLPYEAIRTAPDPGQELMQFLQSTYEAAADRGRWDRAALECDSGQPGVPRAIR